VEVEASAPTRIDLAGGTLDIWPLYLFHPGAQTINAAISLRAWCRLAPAPLGHVRLTSTDTGRTVDLDEGSGSPLDPDFALLRRIVDFFRPDGVAVLTQCESPFGAGIGGSSALAIAACAALARWTGRQVEPDALLELARNLEAQAIGVPTGVQDYPPALFGGIAALELGPDRVARVPLAVDPTELERRIVLAYTGASRRSAANNWEILKRRLDGDPAVAAAFESIRDIAAAIRQALARGDWEEVGRQIGTEWEARKRLAPGVTTGRIEQLLAAARAAGAVGGKICGAGGGGCLLVWTEPEARESVDRALRAAGAQVLAYRIDPEGLRLRCWDG
jgi:D-glycero-alpha-D-manno-heptose-7-phosphate kinase